MKKYKLLKDLPDAKAGTILTLAADDTYEYKSSEVYNGVETSWWGKDFVENKPEWFELVTEPSIVPEIIEVDVVSGNNGKPSTVNTIISKVKIGADKLPAIKQAISNVLNDTVVEDTYVKDLQSYIKHLETEFEINKDKIYTQVEVDAIRNEAFVDVGDLTQWASSNDWTYLPSISKWCNEVDEVNITPITTEQLIKKYNKYTNREQVPIQEDVEYLKLRCKQQITEPVGKPFIKDINTGYNIELTGAIVISNGIDLNTQLPKHVLFEIINRYFEEIVNGKSEPNERLYTEEEVATKVTQAWCGGKYGGHETYTHWKNEQSKQSPKEIISNIELLKKPELKEKYFEPQPTSTISGEQGKDWEVVAYNNYQYLSGVMGGGVREKKEDGLFYFTEGVNQTSCIEYELVNSHWKIHSVKRLSDNTVFSIGDSYVDEYKITAFKIIDDIMMYECNGNDCFYNIVGLRKPDSQKLPTPTEPLTTDTKHIGKHEFLFTTEDDVDIYNKATDIYVVDDKLKTWNTNAASVSNNPKYKYFYLRENRQKYIDTTDTISSKPIIATTFDGVNIYDKNQFISIVDEDFKKWDTSALNCTWNEKLKYFSNKDAANNWVLENKPCLSFTDLKLISQIHGVDEKIQSFKVPVFDLKHTVKQKLKNQA